MNPREALMSFLNGQGFLQYSAFCEHLDRDTVKVHGYSLRPSVALFLQDRIAFEELHRAWVEAAKGRRTRTVEDVLNLRSNRVNFKKLQTICGAGLIVPFVGAGLSIPCGMPGWSAFLREQAVLAENRDRVEALLAAGSYEEAADALIAARGLETLDWEIELRFGRPNALIGAVNHVPAISQSLVLTTNYDEVLETAFKEAGCPLDDRVLPGSIPDELFRPSVTAGRTYLLKLHGDSRFKTDRVLTTRQYDAHYGDPVDFERTLPRLMRRLFTRNCLLFLGCSLSTDRTVRLFREVVAASRPDELTWHFAVLELPTGGVVERERELAEARIAPIWYPTGRHDAVEAIVEALANT
jgi:hypothetical protein